MGHVAFAQGSLRYAAHLWGAAAGLSQAMIVQLSPSEQVDFDTAMAAAQHHCLAAALQTPWAEGELMTYDDVLPYALGKPRAIHC